MEYVNPQILVCYSWLSAFKQRFAMSTVCAYGVCVCLCCTQPIKGMFDLMAATYLALDIAWSQ